MAKKDAHDLMAIAKDLAQAMRLDPGPEEKASDKKLETYISKTPVTCKADALDIISLFLMISFKTCRSRRQVCHICHMSRDPAVRFGSHATY